VGAMSGLQKGVLVRLGICAGLLYTP